MTIESRRSHTGCYKFITKRASVLSVNAFGMEPKVNPPEEDDLMKTQ